FRGHTRARYVEQPQREQPPGRARTILGVLGRHPRGDRAQIRAQTTMTIMDAPQEAPNVPDTTRAALTPASPIRQLLRDYFILTKPSIMLLLLITTVPAMVLAEQGWPGFGPVLATLVGGMLAAGGAGAVNMYI